MAHKQQQEFCLKIQKRFPEKFKGEDVVDLGSLDINGNNRYLFTDCRYIGVDLAPGKNVDVISKAHEFKPFYVKYGVVISTEMLEHDRYYRESLKNMVDLLLPGGLLLITCATVGRPEHGTKATSLGDSPFTGGYYKNITEDDIRENLKVEDFKEYELYIMSNDLYFVGIKK